MASPHGGDSSSSSGDDDDDEFFDVHEYPSPVKEEHASGDGRGEEEMASVQQQEEQAEEDQGTEAAAEAESAPAPPPRPRPSPSKDNLEAAAAEEEDEAPPKLPPKPTRPYVTVEHETSRSQPTSPQAASESSEDVTPKPSPHARRTPPPAAAAAPAAPAAAGGASAQSAHDDEDHLALMTIKNLDTGEVVQLGQAEDFFPEVKAAVAMTLDMFDETHREPPKAQQQPVQSHGKGESEEETKQKKTLMGFMEKVKQVFNRGGGSLKMSGGAGNSVPVKRKKKSELELSDLRVVQDILHHTGPVWAAAWSEDGQFLATGGQDSIVRVWVLAGTAVGNDHEAKVKARRNSRKDRTHTPSPRGGGGGGGAGGGGPTTVNDRSVGHAPAASGMLAPIVRRIPKELGGRSVVVETPLRLYSGHKADVIDLAWSKANFLLSASIDKTVRLWHVSRHKCLCLFQHSDFVTAVKFHPIEDKYFVSGSFDKKLRVWNIPDHCVVEWAQAANIITSATFSPDGKRVVAGLYNGQCVFYQTSGLKYVTQLECRNRHGKFRKGRKVTGLQFSQDGKRLLITTNDSRIRLYDMDDYSCVTKYKGLENDELQIRASFSDDGFKVICGSENHAVFMWDTERHGSDEHGGALGGAGASSSKTSQHVKDRNDSYEYFKAHQSTVTTALFVPKTTIRQLEEVAAAQEEEGGDEEPADNNRGDGRKEERKRKEDHHNNNNNSNLSSNGDGDGDDGDGDRQRQQRRPSVKHMFMTAAYNGEIKFFENRGDPVQ